MKYAILVYGQPGAFEQLSQAEQERIYGEFWGLAGEPDVQSSGFLPPTETPTTVGVRGERVLVTDGPFAETKEVVGGFYVLEVPDDRGAVAFAARVPARFVRGAVEIRPLARLQDGRPGGSSGMRFALVTYEPPEADRAPVAEELLADRRSLGALVLSPAATATTVFAGDDETTTKDGAFPGVGERLSAFYLFEVADRDEAVDLAARVPTARQGGSVEVRTLVQL